MVTKKRRRARKKDKLSTPTSDQAVHAEEVPATFQGKDTPSSLLGESMLSQLRSRLDPIYNPPPQASTLPPPRLPPLGQSTDEQPVPSTGTAEGQDEQSATAVEHNQLSQGSSVRTSQKRPRRRKREKMDEAQVGLDQHTDVNQGEVTAEQTGDELRTTSRDALISGNPLESERRKRKRRQRERTGRVLEASGGGSVPNPVDGNVSVEGEQAVDSSVDGVVPQTQPTEGNSNVYCVCLLQKP